VIGFAVCGAGLSCAVPLLLSVASRIDPARPGGCIARVAGLGYLGLVGGPVLIGGCASLAGLPVALCIPVALGGVRGRVRLPAGTALAGAVPGITGTDPGVTRTGPGVTGTGPGRPGGSRSR
jgi:hypothetical protein